MKILKNLALRILGGQYVPVELLDKARKERDDENLEWAKRYDSSVQYLQDQCSQHLARATDTENEFRAYRESTVSNQKQLADFESRLRTTTLSLFQEQTVRHVAYKTELATQASILDSGLREIRDAVARDSQEEQNRYTNCISELEQLSQSVAEIREGQKGLRASWTAQADNAASQLQEENRLYLERATAAEIALAAHVCPSPVVLKTDNSPAGPQMTDIRVPRKALR